VLFMPRGILQADGDADTPAPRVLLFGARRRSPLPPVHVRREVRMTELRVNSRTGGSVVHERAVRPVGERRG
jgi:hypothetical protein